MTTLAVLMLSSLVGTAIDHSSDRLRPLLVSISVNRASVIAACLFWPMLLRSGPPALQPLADPKKLGLFAIVVVLGIFERLSGVANMLSSERDWAPIIATGVRDLPLTKLNAMLRRIDLICKLVSPLVISAVASVTTMQAAVWMLGGLNALSWAIEVGTARSVWGQCRALQKPRENRRVRDSVLSHGSPRDFVQATFGWVRNYARGLKTYFTSGVCAPSLALSMLHFSALSYSATLVTYLLSAGFSLTVVTVARTVGSVVEVSSTFVAPAGIRRLTVAGGGLSSDERMTDEGEGSLAQEPQGHGTGLARCGLWGLLMQLASLVSCCSSRAAEHLLMERYVQVPVVLSVWAINTGGRPLQMDGAVQALTLFGFLSLSRLGLWVFDLAVQELTQSRVPSGQRSSFGGAEASLVALFELLQWASAALLSDPAQFQYLATASFGAVVLSTMIYSAWVWQQRGHLIHWEKLPHSCDPCCKSRTSAPT